MTVLEDNLYESLPRNSSFSTHMLAGAFAGIAEHSLVFPIDTIKTRIQMTSVMSHTGAISVANQRLWNGIISVIMGAGPAHAFYFATYEESRRLLDISLPLSAPLILKTGISGALATMVSDALMNPFDVIKQRMQAHAANASFLSTGLGILRNEGLFSFYLSYPITLFLNVPFQAIQFSVYEQAHTILNPQKMYSPTSHMLAGAVAGAVASAATTPLDVIKTVLQTRTLVASNNHRPIQGVADAIKRIWHTAGPAGFAKGILPRIFVHMPSTAICWSTYEYFKFFLNARLQ